MHQKPQQHNMPLVLLVLTGSSVVGSRTECRGHLQSLKSLLLDSYSSGCPPVQENEATVNVSLDVHIAAILDLNAVNQVYDIRS